jgi:hypothetical protein
MQATVADPRLSSTDALNLCGLRGKISRWPAEAVRYCAAMALDDCLAAPARPRPRLAKLESVENAASPAGEGRRARIVAITPRVLSAAYSG